jgi:uncharacterized coiled-coil protein SlyX
MRTSDYANDKLLKTIADLCEVVSQQSDELDALRVAAEHDAQAMTWMEQRIAELEAQLVAMTLPESDE